MLRLRNCGLMLVLLATAACEKSVREEREEAISAQREADREAAQAAAERNREVTEANREANKELTGIQREANEEAAEARREVRGENQGAVEDEIERTSGAQKEANEEARDVTEAMQRERADVTKAVRDDLDDIDEKHRELDRQLRAMTTPPTDARQSLDGVARESQSLRSELNQLGTGSTTASVEQFKTRAEQRIKEMEKTLERIDDQVD